MNDEQYRAVQSETQIYIRDTGLGMSDTEIQGVFRSEGFSIDWEVLNWG